MLNTGIFPGKLQIAKIIPVYKEGDERYFTNYRSILLLPTISKIFGEKKPLSRYVNFFLTRKCCIMLFKVS